MENDYAKRELPREVTQAEKMLRDHIDGREAVHGVIKDRINEGEEIVIRVRQQDSEAAANDAVQKVLELAEQRRSQWEHTWEDQKNRLEQHLKICQFYFDLRQVCTNRRTD